MDTSTLSHLTGAVDVSNVDPRAAKQELVGSHGVVQPVQQQGVVSGQQTVHGQATSMGVVVALADHQGGQQGVGDHNNPTEDNLVVPLPDAPDGHPEGGSMPALLYNSPSGLTLSQRSRDKKTKETTVNFLQKYFGVDASHEDISMSKDMAYAIYIHKCPCDPLYDRPNFLRLCYQHTQDQLFNKQDGKDAVIKLLTSMQQPPSDDQPKKRGRKRKLFSTMITEENYQRLFLDYLRTTSHLPFTQVIPGLFNPVEVEKWTEDNKLANRRRLTPFSKRDYIDPQTLSLASYMDGGGPMFHEPNLPVYFDVYEDPGSVTVVILLPPGRKDVTRLSVSTQSVEVSGAWGYDTTALGNCVSRQIPTSSFKKSVALPCPVIVHERKVDIRDGMFFVRIPKMDDKTESFALF